MLAVLGAAAWFTRDRWLPRVLGTHASSTVRGQQWEPLSDAGAARTRSALDRLSKPEGQVFETLTAADIASFALNALGKERANGVDSVQAAVIDDQIRLRASVNPAAFSGSLGMLGALLNAREPLEMTGTMHIVHPGLGELTIKSVKVRDITLPPTTIPQLLKQVLHGTRPEGVSENGLPMALPQYIGDVRVANGRITLYKTVR